MVLVRPPGVYPPSHDTRLLAGALRAEALPVGARVLDLGAGTGVLALTAARGGAVRVTAVDVSRRAVLATRLNALLRGVRLRIHRGDLLAPVAGQRFDLIVCNPPYVPAPPHGGRVDRRWDAGAGGRFVLDRLCDQVPDRLAPRGVLLLVHSSLCGVPATLDRLHAAGLSAVVVRRCPTPFGPVLRRRRSWLLVRGLVETRQLVEELVVIRARRLG